MTQIRRDEHSTEFGLWLRNQPQIDSSLGYIATNIDFMWFNYKTDEWMLIEEKRHMASVKFPQDKMFRFLDAACRSDPNYLGLHVITFEHTSPDDGVIWLDGTQITKDQLIKFLMFDNIK